MAFTRSFIAGAVVAAAFVFPGPVPIVEAVPVFPACEIWVSSRTDPHVAIIDAHTSQPSALQVGNSTGIVATPDGTKVYIAHDSQTLTEVNRSGGYTLSTISASGHTLAMSPSGHLLYAADRNTGQLLEISTATNASTGRLANVGVSPVDVVASRDGLYVYVANFTGDSISKVSTSNFAVTTYQNQGAFIGPAGIALSPNDSTLYVANSSNNTLTVVQTSDMTVLHSVAVSGIPIDVEINSSGSVVYVLTTANSAVVEIPTDTLVPRPNPVVVGMNPQRLAIAPDDSQLFSTNFGHGTVSRVDLASRTVIETIPVNVDPIGIALVPANCTVTPQQAPTPVLAPVTPIWRVSMDPAGGSCLDGGSARDEGWTSVFVGYRYLPGESDCEREGYSFAGWADVDDPDTPLTLPLLVDPSDGTKRWFVAADHSLVAVWAKVEEAPELPEDLSGTAPGAFVGGPDRATAEGGGVVDGYYIPPRTQFGLWMLAISR